MHKLLLLPLALLVAVNFCAAAPSEGILKGKVTDPSGGSLDRSVKTRVLVHWDPSGADVGLDSNVGIPGDVTVETNSRGEFQLNLPPGFYDVFVTAMAFSPKCQKVRIRAGKVLILNMSLEVSTIVSHELAD